MRSPLLVLGSLLALGAATVATAAQADASTPGYPAGLHVTSATSTSFTVALNATPAATSYRMYVARSTSSLYVANITSATKQVTSSKPSLTITGLAYTTAPYYYRVEALNSTSHRWGTVIHPAGLRPGTPAGVRVTTSTHGTYLSWNAQATGDGFVVTQATDSAMTAGRTTRYMRAPNYEYTPYALTRGTHYYFTVAARNVYSNSVASGVVSAVPSGTQTSLRVLTYNVLEDSFDGTQEGGQTVASWRDRRSGAAALIHQAEPAVAAVEEAAAWAPGSVQGYGGRRQIDDLMTLLPDYSLARTEVPPSEHGYFRTGNYIIYNTSTVTTVGAGGHWDLPYGCWAAYQQLQDKATGARFLFVAPHLTASSGETYDEHRQQETESLISYASKLGAADGVPVVYAGDFNSNTSSDTHVFDGPSIAMRAHHEIDARDAAIYRYNEQFNSANQYLRTAPTGGYDIDHIFVDPGVAIRSWGVIVDLHNGQFIATMPSDHNPVWSTITVSS